MKSAGILAMTALMTISVVQVICRYIFGFSLIWSEELSRAVMIWITFSFAGLALGRGEIIAFEVLHQVFPGRLARFLFLIGDIAALVMIGWLILLSWQYTQIAGLQIMPALQISLFWVYIALPIGLLIFFVHYLARTYLKFFNPQNDNLKGSDQL